MLHRVEPGRRHNPDIPAPGERTTDEVGRLAILDHYEILDTPPEAPFERIAAMAASLFNAPISIIGFLDHDRLWFKSHYGLIETEVERTPGVVLSQWNPLVGHEFDSGFFASAPLRTCDGYDIGVLCVIDLQPRKVDEYLVRHLKALANIVMDQLDLRLHTRRNVAHAGRVRPTDLVGTADAKAGFAHLTARQREIMKLVVAGQPSKLISANLGISQRTVENHRAAIMKRTGATSIPALAQLALFATGIGARELLSLASLSGSAASTIVG